MRRMLEEVYFGNINPNTKQFIRGTDYNKAVRTMSECESKLTDLLEGKEKQLLIKMVNAQSEADSIGRLESFIEGFLLGSKNWNRNNERWERLSA